jgi:hypothetical protein
MKKCDVCGSALESRRTNREAPYAYVIGGLPRVGLVGITVHRCARCDIDAPVIPKPGELHRLLAKLFLQKPGLLAGDELRFLRKHALGSRPRPAAYVSSSSGSTTPEIRLASDSGRLPGSGQDAFRRSPTTRSAPSRRA